MHAFIWNIYNYFLLFPSKVCIAHLNFTVMTHEIGISLAHHITKVYGRVDKKTPEGKRHVLVHTHVRAAIRFRCWPRSASNNNAGINNMISPPGTRVKSENRSGELWHGIFYFNFFPLLNGSFWIRQTQANSSTTHGVERRGETPLSRSKPRR